MATKTLLPVLLYIQVNNIDISKTDVKNAKNDCSCCIVPGIKKEGKCQRLHKTPTIRLEDKALYFDSRRSSAYPLQPNSSCRGPPIKKTVNI